MSVLVLRILSNNIQKTSFIVVESLIFFLLYEMVLSLWCLVCTLDTFFHLQRPLVHMNCTVRHACKALILCLWDWLGKWHSNLLHLLFHPLIHMPHSTQISESCRQFSTLKVEVWGENLDWKWTKSRISTHIDSFHRQISSKLLLDCSSM
jgi:hypothetical protein